MMTSAESFAPQLIGVAAVGLVAVLSNRLAERVKLPAPALVLAGAAVAVTVVPALHAPAEHAVERVVTVALALILFDGGMHIGWARFRSAAGPIAAVGVLGTFGTVIAGALLVRFAFGLAWYAAILLATAVAPTDPAVVFSVLGRREISGRSGTILEGESGANDPVGIALMASLIAAGGLSAGAFAHVAIQFLIQMAVGAAVGVIGGRALAVFMRRVPLPSEALYPLRTLACALLLYGLAAVAGGSGFLAVFAAGIVVGDQHAPYQREIQRFHSALASLAEIVAFVVLGLTINLRVIARADVWIPGLILAAGLALVIRPVAAGLCLLRARLSASERGFVLLAGLKGAVPILLASFLLAAHAPDARRLYGIVAIVVVFSVAVQGSLVPSLARALRIPMRVVEPEPWSLGVRLRHEPSGAHRLTVAGGSPADGATIAGLGGGLPPGAWVSLVVRGGRLVPVGGDTTLRAGDDVLVLAPEQALARLHAVFGSQQGGGLPRRVQAGDHLAQRLFPAGQLGQAGGLPGGLLPQRRGFPERGGQPAGARRVPLAHGGPAARSPACSSRAAASSGSSEPGAGTAASYPIGQGPLAAMPRIGRRAPPPVPDISVAAAGRKAPGGEARGCTRRGVSRRIRDRR